MIGGRPARERRHVEPVLLRIGRFQGVPLFFAPSWVLIATAVTVLYSALLRDLVDGLGTGSSYAAALGFALALAVCVLAHELGHTAVSLALGRPVRRVVIFLLGGVSEVEQEIDTARDEFLIAAAGPLVSGLLAGAAAAAHLFTSSTSLPGVLLALLAWSNLIVAVFNLLPGLPLDGGRVLRAAIWAVTRSPRAGTTAAAWIGRALAVLVAASSLVLLTGSWGYVAAAVDVVLAFFMWDGATRALRASAFRDRVASLRIRELLRPGVLVLADVSVAEALRRARQSTARGIVVVDRAERPMAIVEESRVRDLPIEQQPWTPVASVARALEPGLVLPEGLGPLELMDAVRQTPAGEYLIVRADGSPAGILAATDLAAALGGPRS